MKKWFILCVYWLADVVGNWVRNPAFLTRGQWQNPYDMVSFEHLAMPRLIPNMSAIWSRQILLPKHEPITSCPRPLYPKSMYWLTRSVTASLMNSCPLVSQFQFFNESLMNLLSTLSSLSWLQATENEIVNLYKFTCFIYWNELDIDFSKITFQSTFIYLNYNSKLILITITKQK